MINFVKFGSCVTRDIFNFLNPYEYNVSFNCMSGITCWTDKNELDIDDKYIVADNNFEKKTLRAFFSSNCYLPSADYFIFDLGMERLPVQTWELFGGGQRKIVTVTWNSYQTGKKYQQECVDRKLNILDWHLPDRDMEEYRKKLLEFVDMVKEKFDNQHIIYISLRQAKEFIDPNEGICNFDFYEGSGIEKGNLRMRQDLVIEKAEKCILENMPRIWKINMPYNIIADRRHHFGLHTLHFNHLVYEYFADCISVIAKEQPNEFSLDEIKKVQYQLDLKKKYAEIRIEELRKVYEI